MNDKSNKKLAIRVCTYSKYGKGHFSRCLAIRSYLKCKTIWYIDVKDKYVSEMIPKHDEIVIEEGIYSCNKIKNDIIKKNLGMVLIDSYLISNNEFSKIRKYIPLTVISDEFKKIKADLVIYPHPVSIHYKQKKQILSGIRYAPLGREYSNKKEIVKNGIKKEYNILVSMGSIDRAGVTITAIKSINKIIKNASLKLRILIVLGDKSPLITHVMSLTNLVKNYEVLINPQDMKILYSKSIMAVGAPGQSHIERLACGLPTILVAQNNLHKPIINKWVRLGCGIKSFNTVSSLSQNIIFLLLNKNLLIRMRKRSEAIVDGYGASRVAMNMSKIF